VLLSPTTLDLWVSSKLAGFLGQYPLFDTAVQSAIRHNVLGGVWYAAATLLSYFMDLLLTYLVSQRFSVVPYEYLRGNLVLMTAAALYLVSITVSFSLLLSILTKLLLLLVLVIVAIWLLDGKERLMFYQLGLTTVQSLRRRLALVAE